MTNPAPHELDNLGSDPILSNFDESQRERLEKFEAMLAGLKEEYTQVDVQIEELKRQDKTRSATFKQLIARKLSLRQFLDTFAHHGL